jgi:2-methylcitrate dehydratase
MEIYDDILQKLVDYTLNPPEFSKTAVHNAAWSFLDAIGCAVLALKFPACQKLLGPIVPGAYCEQGSRIPASDWELDPVQAAFNIGAMIRWLDYNDTWLAAEWAHPSDNIGAILAVCDFVNRRQFKDISLETVIHSMIIAYEIQGVLAINHAFNRQGLDHVILVKLASALVAAKLLGGDRDMLLRTASQVFVDGQSLRTYRHTPNTGSRKSWAAGDATARGVRLALICQTGEMGYPSAISAPRWGFSAVSFANESIELIRPLNSYVMENILWKIAYPAEFHAQTAVECALKLHEMLAGRISDIAAIHVRTQEPAMRIISKKGPLKNPADRDHCLEYMIAVGLGLGRLEAQDYEETTAKMPIIEHLRKLMIVKEDSQFTKDYYDLSKRAIANAIQIEFKDGSLSEWIEEYYPIGHPKRREQGLPLLKQKFLSNLRSFYSESQVSAIEEVFLNTDSWLKLPLDEFYRLFQV